MILNICIIWIILLVFTNLKSLIRYIRARRFLLSSNNQDILLKTLKKIKVIIPVYNEVKHIKKSIEYFKNLSDLCDVYYVTTSKEKNKATYYEIKRQINILDTTNIFVTNCPTENGTMATQLNYIAKKLPKDSIIAIYNIDSFPEKKTFKYVMKNIKEGEVYQQVSYFGDNNKGILNSAQNWQNRWSIIYEMGKYLRKSGGMNFVYTIGHGLFLNKNILEKYGYWNDDEINEDNEFGYRLIINGIQIKPIPYLEKASFANNILIYIKQQSTWVNGPLYAFSYIKEKNVKNLILGLLNFKAFVSWMFFPIFSTLFLIFSFLTNCKLAFIMLLLIFFYISVYNKLINCLLIKLKYLDKGIYKTNIICDYAFFILHTFGAFITILKILLKKNTKQNKYNTEK